MVAKYLVVIILFSISAHAAKDCVFLHGAGETADLPSTTTFPGYWGYVNEFTPQCATWTFNHADTVSRRFDNETLMSLYCQVASQGTGVISNTIVFTHSMGNNILAAAIRDGVCHLDESSSWYLSAPPSLGSKGANVAEQVCEADSWALEFLESFFNYCDPNSLVVNLAYLSLETTDPSLAGLGEVMAEYATGAMCGTSAVGLGEYGQGIKTSAGLEALSLLVQYGEPNDGMVGQSSCQFGNFTWSSNYTDAFYVTALNHADLTCQNGDGYAENQLPCSWFTHRF